MAWTPLVVVLAGCSVLTNFGSFEGDLDAGASVDARPGGDGGPLEPGTCDEPIFLDSMQSEHGWSWEAVMPDGPDRFSPRCNDRTDGELIALVTLPEDGGYIFGLDAGRAATLGVYTIAACPGVELACVSSERPSRVVVDARAGEHYVIVDSTPGSFGLSITPVRCGDGVADLDEECDDGNEIAGDGCTACVLDGETCEAPLALDAVAGLNGSETAYRWLIDLYAYDVEDVAGCTDDADSVYSFTPTGEVGEWELRAYGLSHYTEFSYARLPMGCGEDPAECIASEDLSEVRETLVGNDPTLFALEASEFTHQLVVVEISAAECGNGVRNSDEECDDGNTIGRDGCDEMCRREFVDELPSDNGRLDGSTVQLLLGVGRGELSSASGDEDVWTVNMRAGEFYAIRSFGAELDTCDEVVDLAIADPTGEVLDHTEGGAPCVGMPFRASMDGLHYVVAAGVSVPVYHLEVVHLVSPAAGIY